MFATWKYYIRLIAIVAVLAVLAGAFRGEFVALAQGGDNDYVDVGLILEVPSDFSGGSNSYKLDIAAVNHGSRTAYDVEVVVNILYPEDQSHFTEAPAVPVGNASLENNGRTLRWSIPSLGGLQGHEVSVFVRNTLSSGLTTIFDYRSYPHETFGMITTSSFESNLHKGNNTARVWSYRTERTGNAYHQAAGNYTVAVSVDNPFPSPGDTVEFTIEANREKPYLDLSGGPGRYIPPPIDLEVDIELTGGLALDVDPDATPPRAITYDWSHKDDTNNPTTKPGSVSYSDGVFTIGTLTADDPNPPRYSVTLPITVASGVALNQQCLTATLTGNPPPGTGPNDDDISDNVAKFCLGEPPDDPVAFTQREADLFTWYDCVGKTLYPCSNENSLELVVLGMSASTASGVPYRIFEPGKVIVHVPDPGGRNTSSDTNSSALVWSTGLRDDPTVRGDEAFARRGVTVGDNATLLAPSKWGVEPSGESGERTGNLTVTIAGPGAASAWGIYDTGSGYEAFEFFSEATNGQMYPDPNDNTATDVWYLQYRSELYIEFSKLGTYMMTLKATAALNNNTPSNTSDDTSYTATETYTFHVGPMADLTVVDRGTRSQVAADKSVLTIAAANNGPEYAVDAQVKIALPSDTQVEDYIASEGAYSDGVWRLTGLRLLDYRHAQGKPEEATLTLILKDGGIPNEQATATISPADAYTVCIGSDRSTLAHTTEPDCTADTTNGGSWHQGTVYDYKPGNNEAKITARGGGAAGTSGGPMAPRFANTPVLTWESVTHVNNWPVHRYQVQYLDGNTWQNLAHVSGDQTHFADTGAGARRSYRVRALNEAGVPGFWSRSASQVTYRQASPPLNVTAEAGQAGEVVVSWEPSSDDGGSPITYYQAQWSRTGTSGWSNACRSDSASQHTCTNTGIPSGETRYYRVAAYAGGLGAWSDLAVATAVAGVPEAPSLSASRATTGSGDNILRAIRLTWSQPRDNGSTIYAYEIDYVDYDQVARKCGTDWEPLDGVGGPYSDSPPAREYLDAGYFGDGLEPGAYRCYRVRAVNNTGAGSWSNAASASAGGAVPPDEWLYLDGEADGQNAITLYWGEPHFDGGAPVTGYQLQYSEDGENWRNLTSTSAAARSYTHTGRKVGETWHYQIRARNSAGWGGWSYPVTVTIEEGATANLSQPTLTAQARTSKEVLLSWNSLCNANREGDCESKGIDGYMVEYSEDGGLYGWERLTWLWTDQTTVLDSTVEPGATRYYRVAGYQEVDRRQLLGRWSQVKSATTADFSVGAPQNFRIEKEGERALRLEWDAVTEGRDAESITGYRIERSTWNGDGPGDFDTSWVVRQTNRGIGPYVETGLTPNTQYYYQVAAVTRNGAVPYIGPYSMVSIFIPPAGN